MTARRFVAALAACALVLGLAAAPVTLARFTSHATATSSFATRQLHPPTDVTGTGGATVGLSWTASSSAWATGYRLLRSATSGSGYAQVKNVTPVSATSTTDGPADGTWYYVLRSYYGNWTSADSNEASVVVGSTGVSTGFQDCTETQADTGGDGNGYQSNPQNGCVQDGKVATDNNSGTTTSNSCSNPGKDRHRFWGYDFALPGSVSSVQGVSVNVRVGTNNNSGTFGMCVQLSWDGGATWTQNQPITFATSATTTYQFGGATDDWGHAWTADELGTGNFRVRLTDVATITNKVFNLDWVGVAVDYTP